MDTECQSACHNTELQAHIAQPESQRLQGQVQQPISAAKAVLAVGAVGAVGADYNLAHTYKAHDVT